jgi:hypothetical protein
MGREIRKNDGVDERRRNGRDAPVWLSVMKRRNCETGKNRRGENEKMRGNVEDRF